MRFILPIIVVLQLFMPVADFGLLVSKPLGLKSIRAQGKEIYFQFSLDDYHRLREYGIKLSVLEIQGNQVSAYTDLEQFEKFRSLGSSYKIKYWPDSLLAANMSHYDDIDGEMRIEKYPSYSGYQKLVKSFQTNYPQVCKVTELGQSTENRNILMVSLSDRTHNYGSKPKFFATGMMHGDETVGLIFLLKMINFICRNYGKDGQVTHLLNRMQICFVPLANPDGLYAGGNNTIYGAQRVNACGIDLNRSYPCKCGFIPPIQAETRVFMNFAEENLDIVSYVDIHSGAQALLYPWSCEKLPVPDEEWWQRVMGDYCNTANQKAYEGYLVRYPAYYLYNQTTHGTTKDYWTYHRPSRGCTMELWMEKILKITDFDRVFQYNRQAFLDYIEQTGLSPRDLATEENWESES